MIHTGNVATQKQSQTPGTRVWTFKWTVHS